MIQKTTEKQNSKTIINSSTKSNKKEELMAIPRYTTTTRIQIEGRAEGHPSLNSTKKDDPSRIIKGKQTISH